MRITRGRGDAICRFFEKKLCKNFLAFGVWRIDRLRGENSVIRQRTTDGRPYRDKGDNEIRFVEFLFGRIFVYQIWLCRI